MRATYPLVVIQQGNSWAEALGCLDMDMEFREVSMQKLAFGVRIRMRKDQELIKLSLFSSYQFWFH